MLECSQLHLAFSLHVHLRCIVSLAVCGRWLSFSVVEFFWVLKLLDHCVHLFVFERTSIWLCTCRVTRWNYIYGCWLCVCCYWQLPNCLSLICFLLVQWWKWTDWRYIWEWIYWREIGEWTHWRELNIEIDIQCKGRNNWIC